ncbi:MAG: substrate-binding periplasmic protein [Acidobacteriota bacterium]
MKPPGRAICACLSALLCGWQPALAQRMYQLHFPDSPPFSTMEGNRAAGVALKVVEDAFNQAGLRFAFQLEPLARALYDAKTKDFHCAFPVQRSQRDEADYKWIGPIYIASSGLYARATSVIRLSTLADARPLRLGALRGSGDAQYLRGFGYQVDEANSQDQNIQKLQSGKIDLWATDVLSARFFAKPAHGSTPPPKLIFVFRKALGSIACNANMPAADAEALQSIVDTMIQTGRIKAEALPLP